ncbi:hypothetical protein JavanS260_0016 [Streptococcus satellite phage Javan260]|uniref:Phage protein n=1 Tax=Streptococcus agalactiae LMG 14747 TaxID=1154860 RepID=V6Z0R0_STRAG|nr:hypothetical protein [Streptococcus hyovaginalis]ESV53801.1 hypothetical protein SAG0136_00685 [Streptococcus agalactiae LMG 14747]QBX08442.1 hypothetical protein JavanS260_0016 [Streptococcus satellite phage Javan260]
MNKEKLEYQTLVANLLTIISALDIVADDLDDLAEVEPSTRIMLELAVRDLNHLYIEHNERSEGKEKTHH